MTTIGPIIAGPQQYGVIFGPVTLIYGDPAIIEAAEFQAIYVDGSPTVLRFDPPRAGVDHISPAELLQFVLDQIQNHGAVVKP